MGWLVPKRWSASLITGVFEMNRLCKLSTIVALALLVASPALADDDAKKKKGKKKGKGASSRVGGQLMKRLEKAEVSEEQKGKIKGIVAKYTEQLQASNKALVALLGPDGRKKMAAAAKKAREDGKKGKEIQAAATASLGLSEGDLAKLKETQASAGKVRGEMTKEIVALLTPEQREKAGFRGGKKKGAKKGRAKKKKKDA